MPNFVLIDGSYYIFYRFFALLNWWKLAKKDDPLDNPGENEEFKKKFKSTFKSKIKEMCKKLKIEDPIIMVGRDCPRAEIWRMKIFPEYKGTRDTYEDDPSTNPGSFFKMAYKEKLFEECGGTILKHDNLEADDCIALTTRYIRKAYPNSNIYIIANDHDYFQLLTENVSLYNLKYKQVNTEKNSYLDPKKNLFIKCVTGDTSDNIPRIFQRCGAKTAAQLYDEPDKFEARCKKEGSKSIYERNRLIIDFDNIPVSLVESFYKNTLKLG